MSIYTVEWAASGTVTLEATDSAEATAEALNRVVDLEEHDVTVVVSRVEQVKTYVAS